MRGRRVYTSNKALPPNTAVSCGFELSLSLLPGRHHLSSQPSQPEAQWPMRKCARISGCGSDKLATLGAREKERRHFWDVQWPWKMLVGFFNYVRGVLRRTLQPPFILTNIKSEKLFPQTIKVPLSQKNRVTYCTVKPDWSASLGDPLHTKEKTF